MFNNKKFQFFILLLLAFIWGSSFIIIKKGLILFSETEVASLRITLAAIPLLPIGFKRIKTLTKKEFIYVIISGFIGTGIPAYLFSIAQKHITSSEASIYNSLTPLFTLLIAYFFFKTKVHILNFIGVIIGLIGSVFLITQKAEFQAGYSLNPYYGILLIIATLMYGFNTNHLKYNLKNVDELTIISVSFLMMFLPSLLFLSNKQFIEKVNNPMFLQLILYLSILALVGTTTAMIIWVKLIKHISVIFASTVTYFITFFAMGWGLLDNENFNINHLIAVICIFAGIYLVNYKSRNGVQ
jgi:drug/metabolite transporter (DMT)-like permease